MTGAKLQVGSRKIPIPRASIPIGKFSGERAYTTPSFLKNSVLSSAINFAPKAIISKASADFPLFGAPSIISALPLT